MPKPDLPAEPTTREETLLSLEDTDDLYNILNPSTHNYEDFAFILLIIFKKIALLMIHN